MIGWCSITVDGNRPNGHRNRSGVVHRSSGCPLFKDGHPAQVWVEDDRMWIPPFDPSRPGLPVSWCRLCEPQPELPWWHGYGSCKGLDADWWFPPDGRSSDAHDMTAAAKKICMSCGVRKDCLEWAISLPEECGVWGGMTARERLEYGRKGVWNAVS